jgi:hypothetical protein
MGELSGGRAARQGLAALLIAFVLLAGAYSIVNPLHEGTDELRHFRFVRVLAETGKLPVQGEEPQRSQSHHPPLFYAAGAALSFWLPNQGEAYLTRPENPFWGYRYWEVGIDNKNMYLHGADEAFPWSGAALAAHLVRFLNVALGAVTVALTAAIMSSIFPARPALAFGAAGLVAFIPMFLYMSGAINNDVVAAATGAAVTLVLVRILRDGVTGRWCRWLGLSFGLALMAKFNLAFFIVLIEGVLLYRSLVPVPELAGQVPVEWRKGALNSFLRANLVVLGLTALIAGWWFVRNQLVYGDPTGFKEVTELWGMRQPWESVGLAWSELPNAWSSLWGRFGYGQIPLPGWVYQALAWACATGGLGTIVGLVRAIRGDADQRVTRSQLALLLLTTLAAFSVLFAYMLVSPAGSMGRFFFPGLPAFAGLIFYGWSELTRLAGQGLRQEFSSWIVAGVTTVTMLALAFWALLGFLAPAYAIPAELPADDVDRKLDLTLSDPEGPLVQLLDYEIGAESVRPGETLEITLTWRTLRPASADYVIFVHLLDEIEVVVAQRDSYPGLGNYPTSHWRPDHTFAETYRVELPETSHAPSTLTPQVGLYSRDWVYRLETGTPDGAIKLESVALEPLPGDLPNPQSVNFGGEVELVGYQISPRAVRPGEEIEVQLYWRADQQPAQNYGIFLHVLGKENLIWAGWDTPAHRSMLEWPLDSPVEEVRTLLMPEHMPPGTYQVEIGVWSIGTGEGRLPIVAEDGHWIDTRLLLSPVRILPPE